jgi:hypothetical protein
MAQFKEEEPDLVLAALTTLSRVATSSARGLSELNEGLASMRVRRLGGWSWRRIMSEAEAPNPLAQLTRIVTDLARTCGGLRRALAVGLRQEGMQVTEIAAMFEVSRQRVSALIRPRGAVADALEELEEPVE